MLVSQLHSVSSWVHYISIKPNKIIAIWGQINLVLSDENHAPDTFEIFQQPENTVGDARNTAGHFSKLGQSADDCASAEKISFFFSDLITEFWTLFNDYMDSVSNYVLEIRRCAEQNTLTRNFCIAFLDVL